jgi:nicotinate-nucleotide pyrophosphorylase (carboxylating)
MASVIRYARLMTASDEIRSIAAEDAARALAEDVGAGDLTAALVPAGGRARARG